MDEANAQLLIVEDNKDLREYYKIILAAYRIRTTANGVEALEQLQAGFTPDLIISDLMMPMMDGLEFVHKIKQAKIWAHLPVIMLTDKHNQKTKIKALRYGIDDYLTRPFDEEELRVRIHNLLLHAKGRNSTNHSTDEHSTKLPFSETELKWLEEVEQYIIQNINSDLLSVSQLGQVFSMSESTLLRQLKRLTGLTPNKYIQEIRLNHAKALLLAQTYRTVAEVAHQVGYRNAQAFSRSFKLRFGKTPTEVG